MISQKVMKPVIEIDIDDVYYDDIKWSIIDQ